MRRRIFVTGSLLATAAAAAAVWRGRLGPDRSRAQPDGAEPLPDGRFFLRDAALAFGTTVSIAAVHENPDVARRALAMALDEVHRIDRLMTVFRPESQVGRLNASGRLEDPDPGLVRVLEFSQELSALSDGAFDVTVQPLWLLFAMCKREGRLPSPAEVTAARSLVGFGALEVSRRRIALRRPGMSITLNGVAQGYAADVVLGSLREHGVEDALIDTGEYGAEGERERGKPWTIGIQHPRAPGTIVAAVAMDGRFLATSGDYATTFSEDFVYNHIFDPHTGYSPRRLSSVAVAAASGMEADGLTKPMMVLEAGRAAALLSRFAGAGAVCIDKGGSVVQAQGIRLVAG